MLHVLSFLAEPLRSRVQDWAAARPLTYALPYQTTLPRSFVSQTGPSHGMFSGRDVTNTTDRTATQIFGLRYPRLSLSFLTMA